MRPISITADSQVETVSSHDGEPRTPRELLLRDIRAGTAALQPTPERPASTARPASMVRPSVDAGETPGKRLAALSDLLSGWDPGAHVQLAFAAEAAQRSATPPAAGPDRHSPGAKQSPPVRAASPAAEPSFVCLDDLCHIRTTLARAELENLQFDNSAAYAKVVAGRVCASCMQPLTLLRRAQECRVCVRGVCRACRTMVVLPPHLVRAPAVEPSPFADVLAGRAVVLCHACRAELGGVRR